MWYLNKNNDISQIKDGIELTDEQAQQIINAKMSGLIVSYENSELVFTKPEIKEPEFNKNGG